MDIDLRLVRYFVVVASELHFGRAAAQLFVSQPALSKQIKKQLETQVGEPLLVRDSRHVDLTPRGQRFYDEAQQLLAMADRLQRPTRTPGIRVAHIHESPQVATCATPSPMLSPRRRCSSMPWSATPRSRLF